VPYRRRPRARVVACGNGGSSLEAQHFTAELVGRYRLDRCPLAGIALSVDGGAVTAIANDYGYGYGYGYGYEQVFARQVLALGRPGDALLALRTSGRSPNVLAAMEAARKGGLETVALTGAGAPGWSCWPMSPSECPRRAPRGSRRSTC